MDDIPLVSIIIPTFNQSEYISESLESVLKQSFQKWECIILDDGSSDNTKNVVEFYLERDGRFRYYYQDNCGLPTSRNRAILMAKGEYILPLDSDDIIDYRYVEEAVNILKRNKKIGIVYAEAQKFGIENLKWDLPKFTPLKIFSGNIIYCSGFFRRADFKKVGGYDERLCKGLEDWDFWLSIIALGRSAYRINAVRFFYRTKEKSMATIMPRKYTRIQLSSATLPYAA